MPSFSKLFTRRSSSTSATSASSDDDASLLSKKSYEKARKYSSSSATARSPTEQQRSLKALMSTYGAQPMGNMPGFNVPDLTKTGPKLPLYSDEASPPSYAPPRPRVVRRAVAPKEDPYVTYQKILEATARRGCVKYA